MSLSGMSSVCIKDTLCASSRFSPALLLHQRARMERLLKELLLEKQKLEQLKSEVNNMEYDALQRRFRRVNSTSFIPRVRTEYQAFFFILTSNY